MVMKPTMEPLELLERRSSVCGGRRVESVPACPQNPGRCDIPDVPHHDHEAGRRYKSRELGQVERQSRFLLYNASRTKAGCDMVEVEVDKPAVKPDKIVNRVEV